MQKFVVIDTETGGLDPSRHSIASLGAVVWAAGKVGPESEIFILEPDPFIAKRTVKYHGITVERLEKIGLNPAEAVKKFHLFLKKHYGQIGRKRKISLAGHNVSFDIGFLRRLYGLASYDYEEFFSHHVLNTVSIIRFLTVAGKIAPAGASLKDACNYFDIKVKSKKPHKALGDARATALLLSRLIALVNER